MPRLFTKENIQMYKAGNAKMAVIKQLKARHKKKRKPALTLRRPLSFVTQTPFLPIKKWATLPYHETFKLATNATPETANTMVWSINGLFDPEVPIGGHQPMGFDQAMLFYDHYTCVASSWTVQAYTGQSDVKQGIAVGYYVSSTGTPITGSDAIVENGLMNRRICPASSQNSRDIITLNGKIDLRKFFGKKIINEDDYRGDAATNPIEQAYLIFFCNTLDTASSVDVVFDVTVNYRVVFSEPRKLAQS